MLLREAEVDLTAFVLRPVVETFDLVPVTVLRVAELRVALLLVAEARVEVLRVALLLVTEVLAAELLVADVPLTVLLAAEFLVAEVPVRWVAWRFATAPDLLSMRPL